MYVQEDAATAKDKELMDKCKQTKLFSDAKYTEESFTLDAVAVAQVRFVFDVLCRHESRTTLNASSVM